MADSVVFEIGNQTVVIRRRERLEFLVVGRLSGDSHAAGSRLNLGTIDLAVSDRLQELRILHLLRDRFGLRIVLENTHQDHRDDDPHQQVACELTQQSAPGFGCAGIRNRGTLPRSA